MPELLQSILPDPSRAKAFFFLFEVALVIASVKLAGHVSHRLGQPPVLGKLLVGVLIGPAVLGWIHPTTLLKELSEIGVVLLMFLAGLETDIGEFKKSARASTFVALGGVVLPFLGGWATSLAFGLPQATAVFTGVLLVATSVSISVQTLRELGYLRSREGVTILGAAVLDDVLGVIVLTLVVALVGAGAAEATGSGLVGIAGLFVRIALFFALGALVGFKLLPRVLRWARTFAVGAPLVAAGVAVALLYAYAAEMFGIAGIVGAYLAGLTLSDLDLTHELYHGLETTASSALTPFFFAGVGLAAELAGLGPVLWLAAALTLVAVLTKLVGCAAGARAAGMSLTSALQVGSGMVARGEVGLIVAAIGLERGLIGRDLFTVMVLVALVTTLVTPPMLKWSFARQAGPQTGAAAVD